MCVASLTLSGEGSVLLAQQLAPHYCPELLDVTSMQTLVGSRVLGAHLPLCLHGKKLYLKVLML